MNGAGVTIRRSSTSYFLARDLRRPKTVDVNVPTMIADARPRASARTDYTGRRGSPSPPDEPPDHRCARYTVTSMRPARRPRLGALCGWCAPDLGVIPTAGPRPARRAPLAPRRDASSPVQRGPHGSPPLPRAGLPDAEKRPDGDRHRLRPPPAATCSVLSHEGRSYRAHPCRQLALRGVESSAQRYVEPHGAPRVKLADCIDSPRAAIVIKDRDRQRLAPRTLLLLDDTVEARNDVREDSVFRGSNSQHPGEIRRSIRGAT